MQTISTTDLVWQTTTAKLSQLKGLPNNPRKITDARKAKLKEWLQKYNLTDTPVINTDNTVISGNQRLAALLELYGSDYEIDVRTPNRKLKAKEVKELALISNTHEGEFDFDILDLEFSDLDLSEFNLELPKELEAPFGDDEPVKLEAQEDDYEPPATIQTDIVVGDLFTIGNHRLLCGDSTDSDAVAKLMNGNTIELLFTSPPYSDMRDYEGGKDLSVSNLTNFIPTYLPYANYQVVNLGIQRKNNEVVEYWQDYIQKAKDCGYKFLSWNVWNREGSGFTMAQITAMFAIQHEFIFVFGKNRKALNLTIENKRSGEANKHNRIRQKSGEITKNKDTETREFRQLGTINTIFNEQSREWTFSHPAMFPVKLPAAYIEAMATDADIICDPFTGSGSTMLSAHQLNRKCYGMELEPKYCEVVIQRILKYDKTLKVTRNGQDVTETYLNKLP